MPAENVLFAANYPERIPTPLNENDIVASGIRSSAGHDKPTSNGVVDQIVPNATNVKLLNEFPSTIETVIPVGPPIVPAWFSPQQNGVSELTVYDVPIRDRTSRNWPRARSGKSALA